MDSHLVKHPRLGAKLLNGKKVALCRAMNYTEGRFVVCNERDDGFHELRVISLVVIGELTDSESRGSLLPMEWPMDQSDVDKIVVPESGSPLQLRGFDFAIAEDSQSASLANRPPYQKPT